MSTGRLPMSTASPSEEDHEVLTHGDDDPPRRGRWLLTAVALVAAGIWALADHGGNGTESPRDALEPSGEAAHRPAGAEVAPVPLPPAAAELARVWYVATAPESFAFGHLWMAFHSDGRFVLDPGGGLLSPNPWARGTYQLDGTRLTLAVQGGTGCRAGDRLDWTVGMLPDGRLDVHQVADNGGRCRALPGVWRARPLEDRDMARVRWRR